MSAAVHSGTRTAPVPRHVLNECGSLLEVGQEQVIHVRIVLGSRNHARALQHALQLQSGERRVVSVPEPASSHSNRSGLLQLRCQHCRNDFSRQEGGADVHPRVFVYLTSVVLTAVRPLLPDNLGATCEARIIYQQRPTFSRNYVLGFVETECSKVPKRPERPAVVGGHDGLRGIFDDEQPMTLRDTRNGVHFAGDTCVVDRNDGSSPRGYGGFDQPLIEIERVLANIHKYRNSAAQNESIRCRYKRIGRQNYFIARLDAGKQGRHFQSRRTRMRQQGLAPTGVPLKPFVTLARE